MLSGFMAITIQIKNPSLHFWQESHNSRYPGQGNEATGKARFPIDVGDAKKMPAGTPGKSIAMQCKGTPADSVILDRGMAGATDYEQKVILKRKCPPANPRGKQWITFDRPAGGLL